MKILGEEVPEDWGSSPFMCPLCWQEFLLKDDKTEHLRKVHGYEILDTAPQEKTEKR